MTLVELWVAERDRLVAGLRRRHGLTFPDAEDVASEAFTRMAEEGRHDPVTLQRKAESLAVDLWRRAYRSDAVLHRDAIADPGAALEAAELRTDLSRAIGRLPLEDREAFCLVEIRGLTEAEAADRIGVSQPTIHRRATRARAALKEDLL